jgi:hypothetical protein
LHVDRAKPYQQQLCHSETVMAIVPLILAIVGSTLVLIEAKN